jgi:flagellar basal-body rod protein FlgC
MGGLFGAMDISASGLAAERLRMDVISNNLANANTTRTANGGPYVKQDVVVSQRGGGSGAAPTQTLASFGEFAGAAGIGAAGAGGVQVAAIVNDSAPSRMVYDPGHPDANNQGYVRMPNVNPVTEMTDLITATRAYEANATAMNAVKSEAQHAIDILR